MARLETGDDAPVDLLELVAVHRVVEKIGEVGEEAQPVIEDIRAQMTGGSRVAAMGLARERVAAGPPGVRRIDGAEAANQSLVDGSQGYLVGRVPVGVVRLGGQREAAKEIAVAVAHEAVGGPEAIGMIPRTVAAGKLTSIEQVSAGGSPRPRKERTAIAEVSAGDVGDRPWQRAHVLDPRGPRRREV